MRISFSVSVLFLICAGDHDVFLRLPSAYGKSLCYMLPGALAINEVTVVVSPSIFLIDDQINFLAEHNIRAITINRHTVKEKRRVLYRMLIMNGVDQNSPQSLRNKPIQFLYVTPDQVASKRFMAMMYCLYEQGRIAYVVVDEAHCISEFSHDYRPAYESLDKLRKVLEKTPFIACTSTALGYVRRNIIKKLSMRYPMGLYEADNRRFNIYYEVVRTSRINILQDITEYITKTIATKIYGERARQRKGYPLVNMRTEGCKIISGIVYCRNRKTCAKLVDILFQRGLSVAACHSGLDVNALLKMMYLWRNKTIGVIVTTKSCGLGISNVNARFVIHWDLPLSLAAYYHETGRVSRDERRGFCRLYYNRRQGNRLLSTLSTEANKARVCSQTDERIVAMKERAVKEFQELLRFCENRTKCRKISLSTHFNDFFDGPCEKSCDVCEKKGVISPDEKSCSENEGM